MVERERLLRVVRHELELPDVRKSLHHCAQQRRADAEALILRKNEQVLHEYDGLTVANGTGKADKRFPFIGSQRQQGLFKSAPQRVGCIRVGRSADGRIQRQDIFLAIGPIFDDLHKFLHD